MRWQWNCSSLNCQIVGRLEWQVPKVCVFRCMLYRYLFVEQGLAYFHEPIFGETAHISRKPVLIWISSVAQRIKCCRGALAKSLFCTGEYLGISSGWARNDLLLEVAGRLGKHIQDKNAYISPMFPVSAVWYSWISWIVTVFSVLCEFGCVFVNVYFVFFMFSLSGRLRATVEVYTW